MLSRPSRLITITIQKSTRTELAAGKLYILSNRPVQFIELFRSTPGLASLKPGIWLLILVRDMIIVSPFTLPLHCPLSLSNFSDRHSHPTPAGLVPSVPATIPVFSLSPVPVSCRLLCTTYSYTAAPSSHNKQKPSNCKLCSIPTSPSYSAVHIRNSDLAGDHSQLPLNLDLDNNLTVC